MTLMGYRQNIQKWNYLSYKEGICVQGKAFRFISFQDATGAYLLDYLRGSHPGRETVLSLMVPLPFLFSVLVAALGFWWPRGHRNLLLFCGNAILTAFGVNLESRLL